MVRDNLLEILKELPPGVELVGAAKTVPLERLLEAVDAGLKIVGHNYVQEAERALARIGRRVAWHMIGHLQTNKAGKAVRLFDMVQTVDSLKLGTALDRACRTEGKTLAILVEINSGEETQKAGVMPDEAMDLIRGLSRLEHLRVMGLMTMGPLGERPEASRPYFRTAAALFRECRALGLPGVAMRYLSMGMSDSYRVAIEEGANMVRVGTRIFGARTAPGEGAGP